MTTINHAFNYFTIEIGFQFYTIVTVLCFIFKQMQTIFINLYVFKLYNIQSIKPVKMKPKYWFSISISSNNRLQLSVQLYNLTFWRQTNAVVLGVLLYSVQG